MIRCTLKSLTMPTGVKGTSGEDFIKYTKIKKNLANPFLKLFVGKTQKDLVIEVEKSAVKQKEYHDHNAELFDDISYRLSKIQAVLEDNDTITISRFDDFAEHKASIDQFFMDRNISYSWLNGKLLVSDAVNILQVANQITQMNVSWCADKTTKATDGCFVITHCDTTLADLELLIADKGLEIQPDRPEITSTFSVNEGIPEEDIDEVFEPLTVGELKKLKSRAVTNKFKAGLI